MFAEPSHPALRRSRWGALAAVVVLVLALPWAVSEGWALWRARRRLGRTAG